MKKNLKTQSRVTRQACPLVRLRYHLKTAQKPIRGSQPTAPRCLETPQKPPETQPLGGIIFGLTLPQELGSFP